MSGLLTTAQAADYLGIHVETLRRLIRSGELPVIQVGARYRIHPDDLPQRILVGRIPDVDATSPRPRPVQPGRSLAIANKARGRA